MRFSTRLVSLLVLAGAIAAGGCENAMPLQGPALAPGPSFKEWWIEKYGQITSERNPVAAGAHRVFHRLKPVAETPVERDPELLVIDSRGREEALVVAIPDGTIVLTLDALELCYRDRPKATGDALIAFVLGHELSHLASDEFPYLDAFFARERYGRSPPMPGRSDPRHPDNQREREAFADDQGLVLMMLAGFDPKAVSTAGSRFFESWIRSKEKESALETSAHPQPNQRAETVRIRLEKTVEQLEYFNLGVRFYQMGAYSEAISLFEVFARQFPGRAVFNNLGLSHFQLAMEILAGCDAQLVHRFKVPVLLDPETLASSVKRAGTPSSKCYEEKRFTNQKGEARRYFENSLKSNPGYLPAHQNLTSLLILANEAPGGLLKAEELAKENPDRAELKALRLLALYQYGVKANLAGMVEESLKRIRELAAAHPESAMIAYNKARLEHEIEGAARAVGSWRQYLKLEPEGDFTRFARQLGGVGAASSDRDRPSSAPEPPVTLGSSTSEVDAWLRKLDPDRLNIESGRLSGKLHRGDRFRALAVTSKIVLLEQTPENPATRTGVIESHGPPNRTVKTTWGEFFDYRSFGFEIRDGRVATIVFFDSTRY